MSPRDDLFDIRPLPSRYCDRFVALKKGMKDQVSNSLVEPVSGASTMISLVSVDTERTTRSSLFSKTTSATEILLANSVRNRVPIAVKEPDVALPRIIVSSSKLSKNPIGLKTPPTSRAVGGVV